VLIFPCFSAQASAPRDGMIHDFDLPVIVEIDGSIPGFQRKEVYPYIANQMRAASIIACPSVLSLADKAPPTVRVVWHFTPMPYAGGAVRYIGPPTNRAHEPFGLPHFVSIEVKLFLNGTFQSSSSDRIGVKEGGNDLAFGTRIQNITRMIVNDALARYF